MATQGQFNTSAWEGTNGNRYLTFYWKVDSIDVANQTTTIYWWVMMNGTNRNKITCEPFQINIDGDLVYWSDTRTKYDLYVEICDGYKTIKHNEDGTKTFNVSVRAAIYSSSVNCTGTKNYDLDVVGKAQILTAPNFTDEDNPTIEYYNPVGNAISSLSAAISLTGETPDVPYRDVEINGTRYTFTLSDTERDTLRAATQGSNDRPLWFYLRSIIDGEYFFSAKEAVFTVINAEPTIVGSVVDINPKTVALTGDNKTLIRYHSTAQAAFTATPKKKATIKTHVIEHNGGISSTNNKNYPNVSGNIFTFVSSDSRGNTANKTIQSPMIDYIMPTVNIDPEEQMSPEGEYNLRVRGNCYNDTFGYTDAAQANVIRLEYRYKKQGEEYSQWIDPNDISLDGNTYSSIFNFGGLDYRATYYFQCRITDKLNSIESAEQVVRSLPVFHWSGDDFVFEVPVYFNAGFNGEGEIPSGGGSTGGGGSTTTEPCAIQNGKYEGDLQITGDLWLKNDSNYGNSIYFGDKSYVSMSEPTDDTFTVKATTINLNAQNVNVNGVPIGSSSSSTGADITSGTWTPELANANAVISYTNQQGWYQKVGNTVSIGWNLKAQIRGGYDTTTIMIIGTPYQAAYSAFGGGIAHNVSFVGGFNFACYGIDEWGFISLRGQACNNTSKQNLEITSSAYYPTGTTGTAYTMTLSGSIVYQVAGGVS